MDINNAEVLGRLVKLSPAIETRIFTMSSFTDDKTGELAQLGIKPGKVSDVVNLFQRFPPLKTVLMGGEGVSRFDALAIAGFPALYALVATALGAPRDAKIEAWVAKWPEDDLFECIRVWRELTMPTGVKDFLSKVLRYLAAMGVVPAAMMPVLAGHLERLDTILTEVMSDLVQEAMAALAEMKLKKKDPKKDESEDTPTIPAPSSSPSLPNSNSEEAEPTLGL